MSMLIQIGLLSLLSGLCEGQLRKGEYATVPSLIKAAGYPTEKHRVTTQDGYVLQMHRIPAGRRSVRRISDTSSKGKKTVLVLHGMAADSSNFVIMGPERSLAYLLADAGYDVWLGNIRGNEYSTHRNFTRRNPKFWEFSFHEHGKYDLPAMIDKVLDVTGLDKIMYIGHSMGTTTCFAMLALKPEYNDKLISFVALAPAVYVDNMRDIFNFFLNTLKLSKLLRASGVMATGWLLQNLNARFCNFKDQRADLCMNFLFAFVGEDAEQNDWKAIPLFLRRIQPASLCQMEHFGKVARTGEFTTFSGGLWGPVKPYNLTNIRIPITLFYGENDQLTEKSQVMRLADKLDSIGVLHEVRSASDWPKFNHLDFVFAKDVGELFSKPLVKYIDYLYNKYSH